MRYSITWLAVLKLIRKLGQWHHQATSCGCCISLTTTPSRSIKTNAERVPSLTLMYNLAVSFCKAQNLDMTQLENVDHSCGNDSVESMDSLSGLTLPTCSPLLSIRLASSSHLASSIVSVAHCKESIPAWCLLSDRDVFAVIAYVSAHPPADGLPRSKLATATEAPTHVMIARRKLVT